MFEIRQAVSTDVEAIAHFNFALYRETGYVVFERLLPRMDEP